MERHLLVLAKLPIILIIEDIYLFEAKINSFFLIHFLEPVHFYLELVHSLPDFELFIKVAHSLFLLLKFLPLKGFLLDQKNFIFDHYQLYSRQKFVIAHELISSNESLEDFINVSLGQLS